MEVLIKNNQFFEFCGGRGDQLLENANSCQVETDLKKFRSKNLTNHLKMRIV